MRVCTTIPLLASFLAIAVQGDPGVFGDIKSDVQSAWASATATSSSSPAASSSQAQNISSLTHPKCESPDGGRDWCGIVVGGDGRSSTYGVSITDGRCKQVALRNHVAAGETEVFSSPVGDWTFGVAAFGLNMTYNGRNISDYQEDWDSWAIEEYKPTENSLTIYGGITNCTSADHETSGASRAAGGAGSALAAVAIGMMGFF